MKVLIEGQCYFTKDLELIFNDSKFYTEKGELAIVNSVGYYFSKEKNEIIYMLPKVFMSPLDLNSEIDQTYCKWETKCSIFKNEDGGNISLKQLFNLKLETSLKHGIEYKWIRQVSVSFYKSLIEYKSRRPSTNIFNDGLQNELNTNIGEDEYSYLDLLLSFVNFFKKNKSIILYKHIEHISNQAKKPKWDKTIRKTVPFLDKNKNPVFVDIRNKKKKIDTEEELICNYFSILNHFNEEHNLNISIDASYNIYKGNQFANLQLNGLAKLRKIKHKYYSDTLKRMYKLCELYFSLYDSGSVLKKSEEFISVNNYNIIFEDMIDKLLTDDLSNFEKTNTLNDIKISDLKKNDDGKIIDHLFEYEGLIDTSNIFYIGDSKYYRPGRIADKLSIYKQFTYAKNIIQYNIDIFNKSESHVNSKIKYRDEITEGYNISPNFLLYGFIEDYNDFENPCLEPLTKNSIDDVKTSFHFGEKHNNKVYPARLFDRDTLFIYQYKINFLYVLNSYSEKSGHELNKFRTETKKLFRDNFIRYLLSDEFEYEFYSKYDFSNAAEIKKFVVQNFYQLNGKAYSIDDKTLIVAAHSLDTNIQNALVELGLNSINKKDLFKITDSTNIIQLKEYSTSESIKIAAEPIDTNTQSL